MAPSAGDSPPPAGEIDPAVATYKALLRDFLNRRPSGTRQKLAGAIGTHKSFVSQISNPAYRVPLPAQYIPTIMAVCHFSAEERAAFLHAYAAAHPDQAVAAAGAAEPAGSAVHIPLPAFRHPALRRQVEETIRELSARVIALAQAADAKD